MYNMTKQVSRTYVVHSMKFNSHVFLMHHLLLKADQYERAIEQKANPTVLGNANGSYKRRDNYIAIS